MDITWVIKRMNDFSVDAFHDLIQLRIEVFVIEQDCPYQELDGLDRDAWHLVGIHSDGRVVACSRILNKGAAFDMVSFGRVIVKQGFRNQGLGGEVVKRTMAFIEKKFPKEPVKISAQEHLKSFYETYGFEQVGKVYLEDGIPHMPMVQVEKQ